MYLLQTGDGDLPSISKVFVREANARKAALKFLRENDQAGELYLTQGLYTSLTNYVRQVSGGTVEKECFNENGELIESVNMDF